MSFELHFFDFSLPVIMSVPSSGETNVREDSIAGGFAGIEINLGEKLSFSIEGQKTNSASGIAGGLTVRF